jgi:hypothetical protein
MDNLGVLHAATTPTIAQNTPGMCKFWVMGTLRDSMLEISAEVSPKASLFA